MMNAVNENSQLDDDVKAFLPHQLEQDYLSCLLGCDEIEMQETDGEQPDVMSLQAEQEFNQNEEEKEHQCEAENETMEDALVEDSEMNTNEDLHTHATLIDEPEAEGHEAEESKAEEISLGNDASNTPQEDEQYMSVEKLSVSAPFVCQLMLIAGVKFAVPLANFSRVIAVPENVEVNSNAASVCLGKFEWQDKSMFLMALKRIMHPADTSQDGVLNASDKIVVVEKDNFGFVCNQMLETVTISAEDVLWRDESSQRYWLAGMVKASGFAILDVKGILCAATGNR